ARGGTETAAQQRAGAALPRRRARDAPRRADHHDGESSQGRGSAGRLTGGDLPGGGGSMEKMKTWKKIVLAAVAVVVVGGTGFIVPTWWGKPWSIEHFYLRAVVQAALRSPMMLTQAGIPLKADELDDRSLEALREETEWLR